MTAQKPGHPLAREESDDEVDAAKAQEAHCPGCRELHIACTLMPCFPDTAWAWFTCEGIRYSFPESQGRLGDRQYAQLEIRTLDMVVGCPGCGRDAKGGVVIEDPDGGDGAQLVRYVCYRCGEVGIFQVASRVVQRRRQRRRGRNRR